MDPTLQICNSCAAAIVADWQRNQRITEGGGVEGFNFVLRNSTVDDGEHVRPPVISPQEEHPPGFAPVPHAEPVNVDP